MKGSNSLFRPMMLVWVTLLLVTTTTTTTLAFVLPSNRVGTTPLVVASQFSPPQTTTQLNLHPSTLLMNWSRGFVATSRTLLRGKLAYGLIPITAGLVGWFTNYLAVQMIFWPIEWRGIPLWKRPDEPLGLFGWQGIVPAKTKKMSVAMVQATLQELLSVQEMINRLDPAKVADILLPQAPAILKPLVQDYTLQKSAWMRRVANTLSTPSSSSVLYQWQERVSLQFLQSLTISIQEQIDSVLSLQNCVVEQMMQDRSLLGKLFQISGKKELAFLTDSGLWFGFLLGFLQLLVALSWDNPWTMSIGGLIVGLATNWIALKWIFQPVNPTKVGPFYLQGLFLRRQAEVSTDFAHFFATQVLTSEKLWHSILTDPDTSPQFTTLFANHLAQVVYQESKGLVDLKKDDPQLLQAISRNATNTLSQHLTADLHAYVDKTLGIEQTLRTRMMAMTSQQFERVLHPIFEEDELTLILAGGGLGFAAGLVQQGLSTGTLHLVPPHLGRTTKLVIKGVLTALGVGSLAFFRPGHRVARFKGELLKRVSDAQWTFYAIDLDRDGFLNPQEVRQGVESVLGTRAASGIDKIFEALDEDHDGLISLEEFERWWMRTANDSGFRRKLAHELQEEDQIKRPLRQGFPIQKWRTVRLRGGTNIQLVWENRRLLLRTLRT